MGVPCCKNNRACNLIIPDTLANLLCEPLVIGERALRVSTFRVNSEQLRQLQCPVFVKFIGVKQCVYQCFLVYWHPNLQEKQLLHLEQEAVR